MSQEKIDEYPFNLGTYEVKISTKSENAQKWFNRAILQCYGFNHEETILCCERGLKYDPECSMLYFLKSFSNGVNYNDSPDVLTKEQVRDQFEQWQLADKFKQKTSEVEQQLIDCLKFRVGDGNTLTHKDFDIQFAENMGKLYQNLNSKYQNIDTNMKDLIAEMYAESLMNLRPWDLWSQTTTQELKYGDPYENTLKIQEVIQDGLKRSPNHPGLRHLLIHCQELSPFPETALCQNFENKLCDLIPDSGHLCHMPSHVEILCGNYHESMILNEKGIEADNKFFEYRKQLGLKEACLFTRYRAHNIHFLAYSAMFTGNFEKAAKASDFLASILRQDILQANFFYENKGADELEAFIQVKIHVLIRFGKWEQLIAEPFENLSVEFLEKNQPLYCSTLAMVYYGQGIAYAVLAGQQFSQNNSEKAQEYLQKAKKSQELFIQAKKNKEIENRTLFNNTVSDILEIAQCMLQGELQYRLENYEEAFKSLKQAVILDDTLPYDEPWGWMVPTRHALAALLLEHGIQTKNISFVEEAEKVYRTDLGEGVARAVSHPNNIWALVGLNLCFKYLKKNDETKYPNLEASIQEKLKNTDIIINASCLCSVKQKKL